MADYSGTPLAKKLGINEGAKVGLAAAPEEFPPLLEPLPDGVRLLTRAIGLLDVIVLFSGSRSHLRRRFVPVAKHLDKAGGLWVAYPKKSSGVDTDLTFQTVQEVGLDAGLVDNKSCAIDDTWSAVRFVYRLKDR